MNINERLMVPATLNDIYSAREIVDQYLKPTPVLRVPELDAELSFKAVLKCENLQPLGAFKARGGIYFMSQLNNEERAAGVVASSAGNHGISITYAAGLFGVRSVIFMPDNRSLFTREFLEQLGAEVIEYDNEHNDYVLAMNHFAQKNNMLTVNGIDNALLHAGVGSYALELIEEEPELDVVIVPVGGGSGVCATATVFKELRPATVIIAAQVRNQPAVYESFHQQRIVTVPGKDTWAKGLATDRAHELPFGVMQKLVDDVVLVDDEQLRQAMIKLLDKTHVVAEPSGAAAFAAARNLAAELIGRRVGIIISGGNATLDTIRRALIDDRW